VLELRGDIVARRSVVVVNGQPRELQRWLFAALVRLVLEHERDPAAWRTHRELGIAKTPEVITRLRDALNPSPIT
jgi:hypothetical protein